MEKKNVHLMAMVVGNANIIRIVCDWLYKHAFRSGFSYKIRILFSWIFQIPIFNYLILSVIQNVAKSPFFTYAGRRDFFTSF